LERALEHNPSRPGLHIHQFLLIRCGKLNGLEVSEPDLKEILPSSHFDYLATADLKLLRKGMKSGECDVSPSELIELIDLLLENPYYANSPRQSLVLNTLSAKLYRDVKDTDKALESLEAAYRSLPRFEIALEAAWYAYLAARYDEALQYIEQAKATPTSKPYPLLWKDEVISALESRIERARDPRPAAD
jgi:tetratricopeptide (TPR) repeat protein